MSLGIAFKGAEGIVLAADSRVTLMALGITQGPTGQNQQVAIPATFDNATKLLRVADQHFVGAVTYGLGALGADTGQPRTAHSYIAEFEAELAKKGFAKRDEYNIVNIVKRLSVQEFARELSDFFLGQWRAHKMPEPPPPGNEMVFLVGGYDENEPYGRVFEIFIPTKPDPVERNVGEFGMTWGGQREYIDRLITGFDSRLPIILQNLNLDDSQKAAIEAQLRSLQAPVPFQFLPLQDCVDLSILLIRTTITIQTFLVGLRGVGGAIDIATITRADGLKAIQSKQVVGE